MDYIRVMVRYLFRDQVLFETFLGCSVLSNTIILILRCSRHQTVSLLRSGRCSQLLAGLEVVHLFLEALLEEEAPPGEFSEDVVPEARPGILHRLKVSRPLYLQSLGTADWAARQHVTQVKAAREPRTRAQKTKTEPTSSSKFLWWPADSGTIYQRQSKQVSTFCDCSQVSSTMLLVNYLSRGIRSGSIVRDLNWILIAEKNVSKQS